MKPKRPLPTTQPFLTFLTNTYRRPRALALNMASIAHQTIAWDIEQIVLPDHQGYSPADAVYGRMPWYAGTPRGKYVHVLGDDDILATPTVVADVKKFVLKQGFPPVVVVRVNKGGVEYPKCGLYGSPCEGDVDLCSYIMREDVWRHHATTYGRAYRCDWDGHLALLAHVNGGMTPYDVLFAVGAASNGRPEVDW